MTYMAAVLSGRIGQNQKGHIISSMFGSGDFNLLPEQKKTYRRNIFFSFYWQQNSWQLLLKTELPLAYIKTC